MNIHNFAYYLIEYILPDTSLSIKRSIHKLEEIGNNVNIGIRRFTTWKKKNPVKNVTLSEDWTRASHNLWFQVQRSP